MGEKSRVHDEAGADRRDYDEFLRLKVEKSRASIAEGRGYTNEEVRMRMKKRFEEWEQRTREADA
jgi:hypothetical protein